MQEEVSDIFDRQGGDSEKTGADPNDDEIGGEEVVVSWTGGLSWVSAERWTKPDRPDPHPPPARRPPRSRVRKKKFEKTQNPASDKTPPFAWSLLPVNYFRVNGQDGSCMYKWQVAVLEPPCRMARGVPARRQWQSVVRSGRPREEYLPPHLCPLAMKVNRGEGGGAGSNNPKGVVKGHKKGMPGRKPGLKVKVREKVGGVGGGGGRKGGGANSRDEGGWGLAEADVPTPQPCLLGEAVESREGSGEEVKSKDTVRGKKVGKKGKGRKDAQTGLCEGGSEKPAGGTEGKRKIGSANKQTSTPNNPPAPQLLPKKKTHMGAKNNSAVSTETKKKAENSIKNVKTKSSPAVHNRLFASSSELENENLPKLPQLKDNKSSQEKKADSEKNSKVKIQRVRTDVDGDEKKRARKKMDKATMAKRKLNRMKKLGFLSAPPRR